ncbi:MAG: hypothetical protein JOZ08_03405 [Verrucomicrobia bacterium]|nr:hypothetical protein [Verrucomicrobiota bacterium]MBV8274842.1 hypothetical protein [Verrucomicrobiota bacterium]
MPEESWYEEPTDLYLRRKAEFQAKRPLQLAAVLRNLARYRRMLDEQPIARLVSAGFIHPEKRGVVALTQQGFKPQQPPTRLYLYPAQNSKTVYLITIGDKYTQREDIQDCYRFIETL